MTDFECIQTTMQQYWTVHIHEHRSRRIDWTSAKASLDRPRHEVGHAVRSLTRFVENVCNFTASFTAEHIAFVQPNAPARFLGTFLPYPHFLFVRWNHDFVRNYKIRSPQFKTRLRHDPTGSALVTSRSGGVLAWRTCNHKPPSTH
jgi:hypothetical protein